MLLQLVCEEFRQLQAVNRLCHILRQHVFIVNEIRADVFRERLAAQRHIGIGQPCRTETVRQRGRFCIVPEQERHAHAPEQDQCAQHTENRVQDQITL